MISILNLDLNWELILMKPVVYEQTGQVNDLVPKVTPTSKKMKKIFRQEFKTPPELIESKVNLTIKEVKSEEVIKLSPSNMKQELTLMEFGF
jgi:hypothetical protein